MIVPLPIEKQNVRMSARLLLTFLAIAVFLSGCSSTKPLTINTIERVNTSDGYYLSNLNNGGSDSLLVILSFSGGGARAASLAYGTLLALRDANITMDGKTTRLLDEIDIITSISGGSYTAGYFGLHGERIFDDFEERFLYRNHHNQLKAKLLSPFHWLSLAQEEVSRTNLAIDYFDDLLFEGKTFRDLRSNSGPFILINSSELATQKQLSFEQRQFDFICVDVDKLPLAAGVVSSSAVPVLFSPVTLENKADICNPRLPRWARKALAKNDRNSRRFRLAEQYALLIDAENQPYLHLYDGATVDNLGVRSILNLIERQRDIWNVLKIIKHKEVRKIVFIVVDSHNESNLKTAKNHRVSAFQGLSSALSVTLNSLSFETLNLLREEISEWKRKISGLRCKEYEKKGLDQGDCAWIDSYLIEVTQDRITDQRVKDELNKIGANFNLSVEQSDLLRNTAYGLVGSSEEFKRLISE